MDRPTKGVIVKSVEIEIVGEMDYTPETFTFSITTLHSNLSSLLISLPAYDASRSRVLPVL